METKPQEKQTPICDNYLLSGRIKKEMQYL